MEEDEILLVIFNTFLHFHIYKYFVSFTRPNKAGKSIGKPKKNRIIPFADLSFVLQCFIKEYFETKYIVQHSTVL